MIGESAGGGDRRPVDAKAPRRALLAAGRLQSMAELRDGAIGDELDRDRETAGALPPRAIGQLRPAQPAPGREQRQRLENIGLAGPILAGERHQLRLYRAIQRGIGAIIGELQPPRHGGENRGGGAGRHAGRFATAGGGGLAGVKNSSLPLGRKCHEVTLVPGP